MKIAIIFYLLPTLNSFITYIDYYKTDSNPTLVKFQVAYTHNSKGQSVANVTFNNYALVTKLVAYVSFRVPESQNDREYKREIVKTVVDVEKAFKGLQSNPIVKTYAANLVKFVDFKVQLPFKPVSLATIFLDCSHLFFKSGNISIHQRCHRFQLSRRLPTVQI